MYGFRCPIIRPATSSGKAREPKPLAFWTDLGVFAILILNRRTRTRYKLDESFGRRTRYYCSGFRATVCQAEDRGRWACGVSGLSEGRTTIVGLRGQAGMSTVLPSDSDNGHRWRRRSVKSQVHRGPGEDGQPADQPTTFLHGGDGLKFPYSTLVCSHSR